MENRFSNMEKLLTQILTNQSHKQSVGDGVAKPGASNTETAESMEVDSAEQA